MIVLAMLVCVMGGCCMLLFVLCTVSFALLVALVFEFGLVVW